MTTALIVNAVLMAAIVVVIVRGLVWAIATQHRDHGVRAAGPLFARRIWSRSWRSHAGSGETGRTRRPVYGG